MANENISFIGVGRIRDQCILASLHERISSSEKSELDTAFSGFLSEAATRLAPGAREKRKLGYGLMFLLADSERCVYGVAVKNSTFPERHAFGLLSELVKLTQEHADGVPLNNLEGGSLSRPMKKSLKGLMDRYDRPQSYDKTAEVQNKVESAKSVMQDNVKKILDNHANIETLQGKTDNLATSASQFNKSAGDLSRMMWWRKVKVTVLLAIVGAAIIAYLVVVIIQATS